MSHTTVALSRTSAPAPFPSGLPLAGRTVVFVHAHPDDEAIFTAVTMHALAGAGARVVLVTATAGELGEPLVELPRGVDVGAHRIAELEHAADILGVSRLILLGRRDSGCPGWPTNNHPASLIRADVGELARTVADVAAAENAEAIVGYDAAGIYGHPDHVAVHRIVEAASAMAGVTSYQATVDADHVRRHGAHLVLGAAPSAGATHVGVHCHEVMVTVHGEAAALVAKRAAMAAHASQILASHLDDPAFAAAYQSEWYLRQGPSRLLESLPGGAQAFRG